MNKEIFTIPHNRVFISLSKSDYILLNDIVTTMDGYNTTIDPAVYQLNKESSAMDAFRLGI